MATGWSWDQVEDELTFDRLDAFRSYWKKFPPVHVLVAGAVGHKPPAEASDQQNIGDLIGMFGPGGMLRADGG